MFDDFDKRNSIEYTHEHFLRGYQQFREHSIIIPEVTNNLLFIDGFINGISHPLIPGFIKKDRYKFKFNKYGISVSEVFPCLDDERARVRTLIFREMEREKIQLTGNTFYFINVDPGNKRVYSTRHSGYSIA